MIGNIWIASSGLTMTERLALAGYSVYYRLSYWSDRPLTVLLVSGLFSKLTHR